MIRNIFRKLFGRQVARPERPTEKAARLRGIPLSTICWQQDESPRAMPDRFRKTEGDNS